MGSAVVLVLAQDGEDRIGYTITWRADEWLTKAQPAFEAGLTLAAAVCADEAVKSFGSSPSPAGGPPGVDTGMLRRSIAFVSPQAAGTPMKAHFGTSVVYGRYLEFGARITAKRARYLAVPVDRALAQRLNRLKGTSPFLWSGAGSTIRAIPGLKYIPPRKGARNGGRLVLASSVRVSVRGLSKKSRTVSAGKTAFVLKDSVVIQPRPWIKRAALSAKAEAERVFNAVAFKRLEAAGLVKRV